MREGPTDAMGIGEEKPPLPGLPGQTVPPGPASQAGPTKGKGTFASNVLTLGVGAVVAQGIKLLSAPVLARYFGPAATGIAGVFDSVTRSVSPATTLNYHLAIILPEKDEEGINLFALSCLAAVGVSLLTAAVMWLVGDGLLRLIGTPQLIPYEWLFPLGVFAIGIEQPLRYWNTRQRQFRRQAASSMWGSLLSFVTLVALGIAGFRSGQHLVLGRMLLLIVPVVVLVWIFLRQDIRFALRHARFRAMWVVARRWKDFPLLGIWSAVLNSASRQVPTLLLVAFFSAEVGGFYGYSIALLALPMGIITDSVAQAFFQHASATYAAGGDVSGIVTRTSEPLIAVSLMPVLMVAIIGPDLFRVILGEAWTEAGTYSAILSPWLFLTFIYGPLSSLYMILERQGFFLLTNIVLFVARVMVIWVGSQMLKRADLTIAAFSAISTVLVAVQAGSIFWFAKAPIRPVLRRFGAHLVQVLPTVLIVIAAKWALHLPTVFVILLAMAATVPYYVWVYRHDSTVRMAVAQSFGWMLWWKR